MVYIFDVINDKLVKAEIVVPEQNEIPLKKYDYLAGCLIAFACKESFKLKVDYKGFLTFMSKTSLIQWYSKKYRAKVGLGHRMYIDSENGLKLIQKNLERK